MSQAEALERGYSFWQHEVDESLLIDHAVPYVPILALVGIYTATVHEREKLTSYHWRHSVLESDTALRGLRLSLSDFHSDELDELEKVDPEELGYPAGLHGGQIRKSMYDGAPEEHLNMSLAEHFLAKHLGLAVHDDSAHLEPLRLTDSGQYSVHNHYPKTAEYIRSSK